MRARASLAVVLAALVWSCGDDPTTPASRPTFAIQDGAHGGGNPHFFFLPPLVRAPGYTGTFDGSLSPVVRVSGPGVDRVLPVTVDLVDEAYHAQWQSGDDALDASATYRITVSAGAQQLGFADVDVVASGSELRNVNTGEYIPLRDGRTLPIRFRIEEGAVDDEIAGLVLWYPFDGDATDHGPRARHAVVNAAGFGADLWGRPNAALYLPGTTGSFVDMPIDAINDLPAGTIASWVRLEGQHGAILVKQHDDINTYAGLTIGFQISQTGNNNLAGDPGRIYYHARNYAGSLASSAIVAPGLWYHLAVSFSASEARLYVDGLLDAVAYGDFAVPFDVDETQWRWPFCCQITSSIGSWNYYGYWLSGQVDDVRVYDRMLAQSEIALLARR